MIVIHGLYWYFVVIGRNKEVDPAIVLTMSIFWYAEYNMAVPKLSGPTPGHQLAASDEHQQPTIGTNPFYLFPAGIFFCCLLLPNQSRNVMKFSCA